MWSSSIHLLVLIQPLLIIPTSIFTKNQEFYTWLVEERKINPETVSKEQQKKEFSRFVEDYNTGISASSSSPSSHSVTFIQLLYLTRSTTTWKPTRDVCRHLDKENTCHLQMIHTISRPTWRLWLARIRRKPQNRKPTWPRNNLCNCVRSSKRGTRLVPQYQYSWSSYLSSKYQVGRMKLLGMDVKQNFGVRMDGTMFDGWPLCYLYLCSLFSPHLYCIISMFVEIRDAKHEVPWSSMSQDEEESSFFERERDRLSRDITSVSRRCHTVEFFSWDRNCS